MTSRRHRQPITAAGLGKAFTGNGGHDGDPWRFVLTFWNTGGLAAASGRETVATMSYAEMAAALGSLRASQFDAGTEEEKADYRALLRMIKWLETHGQADETVQRNRGRS